MIDNKWPPRAEAVTVYAPAPVFTADPAAMERRSHTSAANRSHNMHSRSAYPGGPNRPRSWFLAWFRADKTNCD